MNKGGLFSPQPSEPFDEPKDRLTEELLDLIEEFQIKLTDLMLKARIEGANQVLNQLRGSAND